MDLELEQGQMATTANMVKVWRYFYGLTIETNNFAFEIKVILGQQSTHPGCQVANIGLYDPHD